MPPKAHLASRHAGALLAAGGLLVCAAWVFTGFSHPAAVFAAWLALSLGVSAIMAHQLRRARLERMRLAAELSSSTRELQLSRRRLLDATVSERRRLQRNLHDSAQQQLVSMRVKLGLAQSSMRRDRTRTEHMLSSLQTELDAALQQMRALANGIYPPVLTQYGLAGSLQAACERASIAASLQAHGLRRYDNDIEGALYFTCVEAVQNAEKHAGPHARVSIHVWEESGRLHFCVCDTGVGFSRWRLAAPGAGILNMHDRIEALGGSLTVNSAPGRGTTVAGVVPLAGHDTPLTSMVPSAGRETPLTSMVPSAGRKTPLTSMVPSAGRKTPLIARGAPLTGRNITFAGRDDDDDDDDGGGGAVREYGQHR